MYSILDEYKSFGSSHQKEHFNDNDITFIIPTIGRPTLPRTLASLKQMNIPWKAIVVFDGIQPNIEDSDPRITITSIEKRGKCDVSCNNAGEVRNRGIRMANTKWIGFVDDDDTLCPTYLTDFHDMISIHDPDVIIFRMLLNGMILPPLGKNDFRVGAVGISFCLKKSIMVEEGIWFEPSSIEDFILLDKLRSSGKKIKISDRVNYIVR